MDDSTLPCVNVGDRWQQSTLRLALDQIDTGIVLLDSELQMQFVNRAFVRLWRVSDDELAMAKDFAGLMRLIVHKRTDASSPVDFAAYIEKRTALVRAGIEDPRDVRLDNGDVIRVTCKALPDGGRMLVYSNVSDLVHHADQLRLLATTDSMTGLYNRRHFFPLAEREWERFKRYRTPLSILMADIDRFKAINDRHGHQIGDQVIVEVASICVQQSRTTDVVARFGGEEFVMLLPQTGLRRARVVAERVRKRVAEHLLSVGGERLRVTISIGIAQARRRMHTILDPLKLADQALYAAKRNGRDRVCVTGGPSQQKKAPRQAAPSPSLN